MTQPHAVPAPRFYPPIAAVDEASLDGPGLASRGEHLDQLLDNLPEAIVLLDLEWRVLRVNPEFCRLFGFGAEEAVGQVLPDLIVPDFLRHEELGHFRAMLRGERVEFETVRRRADGSLLDAVAVGFAVQVGGEPVAVYVTYRDISERKRVEAERHELLVRERRGHGEAPTDGRREAVLARATELLHAGGSPEEVLARLARFLVPELADSCIVYLQDAPGSVRRLEVVFAGAQQEHLLREQLELYPPELPRLIPPVARALNTGEAQLLPEVSIGALKAVPGDTEHVSVALLVGLTSLLVVPLRVDERTVGAISLGTADSGRQYHADDLVLAEEIARRAAAIVAPRMR